jgi:pilus assembly protein CpaF
MDDLIAVGAINEKAAEFLTACIKGKLNMLISGGTGVGKTTILQILLKEAAPRSDRIVTVEDTAELHLDQENLVPLETRVTDESGKGEITLRDLIRNALRMSPDRIIIGEVRGDEVVDMLQAMVTGHTGAIGIIHGNSPREVIARMETMVLMSGIRLPLSEIRKQIASTIHVVVHLARMSDGSKKVAQICEIRGIEREEVFFNDLFVYNVENITEEGKIVGSLKPAIRYYPLFYQRFLKMGILSDKVFAKEAAT